MRGWLSNLVRREIRAIRAALRGDEDPSVRPASELRPDPANPIAQGMKHHGQTMRVLTLNGNIIAGHHTISAARQLGWKTVKAKDIDTGQEYEIAL